MELKYFRLIKTIAEEGNISNSATRLFLTQSALSHQLRDIESRMGFKVFLRKRNQWKLTEEGQELYQLANTVLSEIDKGLTNIQKIKEGSKGKIRISTECYSFYQGLPQFIQKMSLLYPDILIDLDVEATHRPVSKVLSKDLDMAIVTSKPINDALVSVAIFEDEIFAILHKENRLNEKPYIAASDFSQTHLIIHSFPLETVSVYEHFLKMHHVEPLKVTAIPLTEVALELVNANMGVMCMPNWALKPFKLPKDLIFKSLGNQGLKRTHYLTFHKDNQDKKYYQDFIQNLEEEFCVF